MHASARPWVLLCSVFLASQLCVPASLGSDIPKDLGAWRLHWYAGEVTITVESDETEEHRVFGKSLGLVVAMWINSTRAEDPRPEIRMHFVYIPIHFIDRAKEHGLTNLTPKAIQQLVRCPGPRDEGLRFFGALFRKRRVTEFPSVHSETEGDEVKVARVPVSRQYWWGTFISPGVVVWMGRQNQLSIPVYDFAEHSLVKRVFQKQLFNLEHSKVIRVTAQASATSTSSHKFCP